MAEHTVEISVKGKWSRVPALHIDGNFLVLRGRWLKIAVVHNEEWLESEIRDPEFCVKKLKEQRSGALRADIFTFSQKPPATLPKHKYPMVWDSVAAIRLTGFKDWWEKLPQETRKNVRRSQKRGVVVTVRELDDALVRGLVELNNDSRLRQGARFVHYGKTFDQVMKDQSTYLDRSDFICAYLGSELVGFMKLVYGGQTASILQFLPKASHSDKRPANALLAKAVELCEAKGVACLVYGKFNYGNKRESSLREFKVRNGFGEILIPRFYVPLTEWGALCMKLGLHRGLLGILPHSLIKTGVNVRKQWYNFRQSTRRCSSMVEQPNSDRQTVCSNPPAGSNSSPAGNEQVGPCCGN